jgi:ATP/maltotriose-dependent transcriptional regulator MalT
MSPQNVTSSGVSRARSQPPALSANFLSRKHLFNLFESNVPGATLVIAPAGFGKTTLVAEWVKESDRVTFWYTVDITDTIQDFQAHVISAITAHFPNFFANVDQLEHFEPGESIQLLAAAVAQLDGEYNFVIDAGRAENHDIAPYAQLIADCVPSNCHLVIVRRSTPMTSLARYAALGNLSVITSEELKFSKEEVELVAAINGVDLKENGNAKELAMCEGWPSAVQLMCRNISKGNSHTTFSKAIAANVNPLGVLAIESYNTFSQATREKLRKLAIIEEFDLEIASVILGKDHSEELLNRIAIDGLFVTASTTMNRTYRFNPIIYEALTQIPHENWDEMKAVQQKLSELFALRGDFSKALYFAYESGDKEQFANTFRLSVRQMAAIGRGDLLIKWAHFAGDDSAHGEVMKKAIRVVGHLVSSEFQNAEALASELEYIAGLSPDGKFLNRLSAMVKANIYFARGDFERTTKSLDVAISKLETDDALDSSDLMALLRLRARQAFLYDDFTVLADAYAQAKLLPGGGEHQLNSYQLACMQSMVLYSEGQYFQAAEISQIAISQAKESGFVGINGPLDAMLVLARAQLEASDLDNCIQTLNELMNEGSSWEIWPWYLMAEGTLTRIQISQGAISTGSEAIAKQRAFLSKLHTPNQLSWMIDMSEVFLRLATRDWSRADELVKRMPKIELVRQIEGNIQFAKDPKKIVSLIDALPERTVREKINKWLSEVSINLDHENVALKSLNKALALGAENGYHEYFIRQSAMYSLIVKAAAAKPTIYMEGLVQAMTERLHTINTDSGELEEKLTQRELEILKHLTTGNPISAIAKTLHISQNTMKTHLRNTYRKLEADGRHSAVEKAKKLLLI